MEIALHTKLKNGPMFRYRQERGLSQGAAAEHVGIGAQSWNRIENLNFDGVSQKLIDKIAICIAVPPDEIRPPELKDADLRRTETFFRRVDTQVLLEQHSDRMSLPDPSSAAEQAELAGKIKDLLRTLTYRDREILKLRWGLLGTSACTLAEVGTIFQLGNERVRQIELRAIRRLQHPSRSRRLEQF